MSRLCLYHAEGEYEYPHSQPHSRTVAPLFPRTLTCCAPTLPLAANTEGEYEYAPEDGNDEAGAGEGAAEGGNAHATYAIGEGEQITHSHTLTHTLCCPRFP